MKTVLAQRIFQALRHEHDTRCTPMDCYGTKFKRCLALVQAEYLEMPGLHLTKPQVRRLWCLDTETCDTLLNVLVAADFLRRTPRDAYVLSTISR